MGVKTVAFLKIENLTKKFGGLVANSDISIQISQGEIVGIIGPNGAGKSTFFATVSGFYRPDGGNILFKDEEIGGKPPEAICQLGIARTFQIVRPLGMLSVLDNVLVGAFLRNKNRKAALEKAEEILEFTALKDLRDKLGNSLTIADKKRLELARAMATQPELLMLDEVMAGLTPKETQEAVELIKKNQQDGDHAFRRGTRHGSCHADLASHHGIGRRQKDRRRGAGRGSQQRRRDKSLSGGKIQCCKFLI
jgi:branched-chain amino acid transport system ATP-binding protein